MTEEDSADLHKLIGLPCRAQGRTPDGVGKQYWD